MELAQQITKELNDPMLGYNKVQFVVVDRILRTLKLDTIEDVLAWYGDNYEKPFRDDYSDYVLWNTKQWIKE